MTNNILISNFALHEPPAELHQQVMKMKGGTTSFISIGFCPGVAQEAWKHAPIILLLRSDALLQAHPPFLDHPKAPMCLVLLKCYNLQQ